MTIGVTGATGGVGSAVVRGLLERGDVEAVVALARRADAVPARPALAVRRADYDDQASLRQAFEGLDCLVFVSSDGDAEAMGRHHRHVVAAAADAGLGRIVYTSILDIRPDSGFYYSPLHRRTEAAIAGTGIPHLFARTSVFSDFFVETWIAPALESGVLSVPAGDGEISLVTRADVAAYLASAAAEGREGVVEVTGPQALDLDRIASVTSAETGRDLRYAPIGEPEYRERLERAGTPEWLRDAFASMFGSVAEGRFAAVSPTIAEAIGRPGETYAEFVRGAPLS